MDCAGHPQPEVCLGDLPKLDGNSCSISLGCFAKPLLRISQAVELPVFKKFNHRLNRTTLRVVFSYRILGMLRGLRARWL